MRSKRATQKLAAAAGDTLARLVAAAAEDAAFRQRLRFVLELPSFQRASLVESAVTEMRLQGEDPADIVAFASLADDALAAQLRAALGDPQ